MKCPKCKNDDLQEKHAFCFECGFNLRENNGTTPPSPSQHEAKTESEDFTQGAEDSDVIDDKACASPGKFSIILGS